MKTQYKYILDPSSKKFDCPSCKQKRFTKYINQEGVYLADNFGRCDRENSCGYHNTPKPELTLSNGEKPVIFPNGKTDQEIKDMTSNFHIYCDSLGIPESHMGKMLVGKKGYSTAFGIHDGERLLNLKYIPYNETGNRIKKDKFDPVYLSAPKEKRYKRCLYGLHLFDPSLITILIESEKTAVIGKWFYPDYNWLATGGNSGATFEHLAPIYNYEHPIIYLADNDNAGRNNRTVKHLSRLQNTNICNPFGDYDIGYDVADWIRDNPSKITGDIVEDLALIIKESVLPNQSVEIDFAFEVEHKEPIVMINNVRVCSFGNMFAIIAYAGTGKSQTCEAICAGFINPNCDSLGIEVSLPDHKELIYIDGERTHEDAQTGFRRIAKRIGIESNPQLREGDKLRRFHYQSFIGVAGSRERKEEIERLVKTHDIGLLLIDDITCLIDDINDNKEANIMLSWLIALANNNQFGIVCTIHPNPKDSEFKPRGHIGTRVWHVSEAVYLLRKAQDDPNIRRLTTDFPMAKTRSDTDVNETNFSWDDNAGMFMTADYEQSVKATQIRVDYSQRFKDIFMGQAADRIRASDLFKIYMAAYQVSLSTAQRHTADACTLEIIKKEKEGKTSIYRIKKYNEEIAPF